MLSNNVRHDKINIIFIRGLIITFLKMIFLTIDPKEIKYLYNTSCFKAAYINSDEVILFFL